MNDIITKEISKSNPNLRTKLNASQKNEEEIMKANLKKLHVQRKIWNLHSKLLLQFYFFYVNDNKNVMLNMHKLCIVSCVMIVQSMYQIQEHKQKKRLISYCK
jgi:hypothetical protein